MYLPNFMLIKCYLLFTDMKDIYIYIYKGQDQVILCVNFRNVTPLNFLLDVNFKKFIVGLHFLLITFMHMKF